MPFLKRKTMLYFILAKIFMFPTKFAGWMHLDVFSPPGSRLKRMIHSLLLPFCSYMLNALMPFSFFLIKLAKKSFYQDSFLRPMSFCSLGGEANFYAPFVKMRHDDKIILQGERIRDLPAVMNALKNSDVNE